MSPLTEVLHESIESPETGLVGEIVRGLGLEPHGHKHCSGVVILRKTGSTPIAALLQQTGSFREDRRSIERLKAADQELPIIYVARSAKRKRETAIRRLGIHYFLAEPMESEELKLVLEALVRAAESTSSPVSYERFFTR